MATVYLIGGTGNQIFQYATSEINDEYSSILLSKHIRKILGWTNHDQVLQFPTPSKIKEIFNALILIFDTSLSFLFRISLFTEFDTRKIKLKPRIKRLVAIGYFQSKPIIRNLTELNNCINLKNSSYSNSTTMHIRGGDLLKVSDPSKSSYGQLGPDYYKEAIIKSGELKMIEVYTDDIEHAQKICHQIGLDIKFTYINSTLSEMISKTIASEIFISSNSTLSYWITQIRGSNGITCAPKPFQKNNDFALPNSVLKINAKY